MGIGSILLIMLAGGLTMLHIIDIFGWNDKK